MSPELTQAVYLAAIDQIRKDGRSVIIYDPTEPESFTNIGGRRGSQHKKGTIERMSEIWQLARDKGQTLTKV